MQSHAAAAVINFCEHCDSELLAPYLNDLLGKLYALLQTGKVIVQEQAVTAIAAVADAADTEFLKVPIHQLIYIPRCFFYSIYFVD